MRRLHGIRQASTKLAQVRRLESFWWMTTDRFPKKLWDPSMVERYRSVNLWTDWSKKSSVSLSRCDDLLGSEGICNNVSAKFLGMIGFALLPERDNFAVLAGKVADLAGLKLRRIAWRHRSAFIGIQVSFGRSTIAICRYRLIVDMVCCTAHQSVLVRFPATPDLRLWDW